jgi:hypothetical protein
VDYNPSKQQDVMIVQAVDKVFAFKMTETYPSAIIAGDLIAPAESATVTSFDLVSYQPNIGQMEAKMKVS